MTTWLTAESSEARYPVVIMGGAAASLVDRVCQLMLAGVSGRVRMWE